MTTWTVPAAVDHVVDGDTAVLLLDLGWHISYTTRVRLAGIDAPELSTPEGKAAKAHAEELLPAWSLVTFTSHSLDKYGRPLGRIALGDGADVGALMMAAGHAKPYDGGAR